MNVACLHVSEFLVELARRENPALRGRPVVIGGSPDEHGQVRACSREAAEAGVAVAMTLRRALSLCPQAVFLPFDEGHAITEAARLIELLEQYSPVVEAIAPGHAHFDVRGLAQLNGLDDEVYLREIHEIAAGRTRLPVRLAAAETLFVAHATASFPDAPGPVMLIREEVTEFLAGFPVEVLPVDPEMHQRLRLFGLDRLGHVAALPFSAMQAQFGHDGAHAWKLINGKDDSVIVPRREEVRVDEEVELSAPVAAAEPLIMGTRSLLQRALSNAAVRGHSLRRLDWRLGLESGEQVTRRVVFREPTSDPARMLAALKSKIDQLQIASAAISLGLTLSGLCSEYGRQANLWPTGPRRREELHEAIEQLNARVGSPQVYHIVEVQPWSRIPERQMALVAFDR